MQQISVVLNSYTTWKNSSKDSEDEAFDRFQDALAFYWESLDIEDIGWKEEGAKGNESHVVVKYRGEEAKETSGSDGKGVGTSVLLLLLPSCTGPLPSSLQGILS